jgi:hypothetical protein
LEARLCQHGDAVEQLKHSPASSQNSGTLCIPSAIKALLDIYDELDDESKKALLSSAISINTTPISSLGPERYEGNFRNTNKVPELHVEEEATK